MRQLSLAAVSSPPSGISRTRQETAILGGKSIAEMFGTGTAPEKVLLAPEAEKGGGKSS